MNNHLLKREDYLDKKVVENINRRKLSDCGRFFCRRQQDSGGLRLQSLIAMLGQVLLFCVIRESKNVYKVMY